MTLLQIGSFLALASVAAYLQTTTGFAFGLVMMAGIALTGALSLPDAAVFVGLLTLVNALLMLRKGWRHVTWRLVGIILLTGLPALGGGYLLLEWLAESSVTALKLLLGGVTMLSSLQLALSRHARTEPSAAWVTGVFGILSGLMGGLFSTAGPPLVYHLYRQPLPVAVIRETLVAVFGINAVLRLALVAGTGNIPSAATWPCLLAIPMVWFGTAAARRFPPPMGPTAFRWLVLTLLFLSGVPLVAPALLAVLRGDLA